MTTVVDRFTELSIDGNSIRYLHTRFQFYGDEWLELVLLNNGILSNYLKSLSGVGAPKAWICAHQVLEHLPNQPGESGLLCAVLK
jgi:hypothetical protein